MLLCFSGPAGEEINGGLVQPCLMSDKHKVPNSMEHPYIVHALKKNLFSALFLLVLDG